MIKLLSIGNSFSQDAHRYLHNLAKNEGEEIKCVNLFVGGCSLKRHYGNMLENKAEYMFEYNGEATGIKVTLSQALLSDDWDYITLQQASSDSPFLDTYIPYLQKLAEYVRLYSPKSKIMLHQTWAYEQGSKRLNDELHFADQHDMLEKIVQAYNEAAQLIRADGIIRSGEAMMKAIDAGISKVHRDTFHADLGFGRYLLACVWYEALTGKRAQKKFNEFDVDVSSVDMDIFKKMIFYF